MRRACCNCTRKACYLPSQLQRRGISYAESKTECQPTKHCKLYSPKILDRSRDRKAHGLCPQTQPPRCLSHCIHTCCGMRAAISLPTMGTIPEPCSTISATRTSSTPSDTPSFHPTGSATSGEISVDGLRHLKR